MKRIIQSVVLIIFSFYCYAQPGNIDNTFNPGTGCGNYCNSNVLTTAIQSDGKIIIGGCFQSYNGTPSKSIARLNADGTLDTTFNPPPVLQSGIVLCTAIQSNGKIIVGGNAFTGNGISVVRLNSDGSLDNSFNLAVGFSKISDIAIQTDGKIIIGGYGFIAITRLNADGSLDTTFNPPLTDTTTSLYTISLQNDGKIIIGGDFGIPINHIARLNADGTLDSTFNPGGVGTNGTVYTTSIQSDGKIIIGGLLPSYNGTTIKHIARLNADGTLDSTFNTGSWPNNSVRDTAIQNNGKIIIGGEGIIGTTRLNGDGSLDTTFNRETFVNTGIGVFDISLQNDGKIIIGGNFTSYKGTGRNGIARINGDNALETSFIEKNSILVYPNPVNNLLQIQTPYNSTITSSKVLDISGKLIFEQNTSSNTIYTETLSKGFYILEVFSCKDKFTSKFIKE
jgi:uncharacterized delta-60 repeat protein